ncbi:hypothetical protein Sjap_018918 [Stephania japonica]|uniref:Retrotransposon Copia-like N-terminal domain-containing protein n=1 Tax=Stephania japonica TaxID=461633 RepID=A0AAP0NL32_9MAGN
MADDQTSFFRSGLRETGSGSMVTGSTSGSSGSTTQHPAMTPFGNSLNQIVSMKLDRNNFLVWKAMVLPIFRGCRLDGHLLGTLKSPSEFLPESSDPNPAYEDWYGKDQFCLGWLISAMSNEVAHAVVGAESAQEAWKRIEEYCGSHNRAQVQVYRRKIQNTKKGSMTMSEYLLKMKEMADFLATAGSPVSDDDLVSNTLTGLDGEYLPIISVLQEKETLRWTELHASLLSFEMTLSQFHGLNSISSLSIHDATPSVNSAEIRQVPIGVQHQQSNSGGRGSNTRNRGGRSRGRGGFRSQNSNKPTCQICGKFGHSATVCYFWQDMKYMGAPTAQQQQGASSQQLRFNPTPTGSPHPPPSTFYATSEPGSDTSWYADSGAT